MPSWAECPKGHGFRTCREAAGAIARHGSWAPCPHPGCDDRVTYHLKHAYPGKGRAEFVAKRIVRVYSDLEAEREGYDPMLLLLENKRTREQVVWTFYWTKNRKKKWHVGQFPPLFSKARFAGLTRELLQ